MVFPFFSWLSNDVKAVAVIDPSGIELVTHRAGRSAMLRDDILLPSGRVVYRMGMPATTHDWTVDMLDALPDDGQRYEIIDGELFVTPAPGEGHQDIVKALLVRLAGYIDNSGVGSVMVSPADIWRGERSRNRVQPDVFVIRRTHGKRPEYPYHLNGVLLAVEVVSPGNPLLDYHTKRELYQREGVGEYWIFDPEARIVSRWRGRDERGETLSVELCWKPDGMSSEFVLNLPQFFDEAFR